VSGGLAPPLGPRLIEGGAELGVWAPYVRSLAVRLGDRTVPLERGDRGVWRGFVEGAAAGHDYLLVLDGERERPDPRSRFQPYGVHGPSRLVDLGPPPAPFAVPALADLVFYELHIGTFTPEGTLDSAIEKLDHLVDLGVTHVELLPVNGFNGTHNWGYDGVAWFAVHEAYGGPAAYRRFVDAAHAAGLAVIQDVVYNHLGPSGNYLPEYGPYLRDAESNTWGLSVNLDEPAVRSYIVENALMWLREHHVDGLRLDAVHALLDRSDRHILRELAEASDALAAHLRRPLTLIAESDLNDPGLILPREAGGYGLTAQWSDDFHHALHVAVTGETAGYYADFAAPDALAKVWTRGFFHDGTHSSFRGRDHGQPIPAAVPTSRLVTFAQDHDQIGNRATGDRLTATLSYGRLAVAAVVNLTAPSTPMLFMGEEWGASTPWQFFTSHPEPELGAATARGRIAEFARMGWDESAVPDPQDTDTFERSKLRWSEAGEGGHARLLDLHRRLAALRRERPELTDPSFASLGAQVVDAAAPVDRRCFVLRRGPLTVLVNLSDALWGAPVTAGHQILLTTDAAASLDESVLTLPAESAAIVGPVPA
jgi:maltooligosyltrehalose trehalohydrolase